MDEPNQINKHRFHVAILGILLMASLFVASPLFQFLLEIQAPVVFEREFSKVEINSQSVFAEVVRRDEDLRRGLSGRQGLGSENGMLFAFSKYNHHAIWMKGMLFPIDIVWISGDRVVDFEEQAVPPPTGVSDEEISIYYPDVPANLVLEVPAGFVAAKNIRIGDAVIVFAQDELDKNLEKKFIENRKEELRRFRLATSKESLTIEALKKRSYKGSDFRIVRALSENESYTKYEIRYQSDSLTISGVMNVPKKGKAPYPVVILNHGYIDPEVYIIGHGSRREQDFLTRSGYATIHPDYRGYGFSSPDPSALYDFNVGYTIDVMNLIEALKKFKTATIDISRIGMWGHSMGGGITERIMVLRDDIKAFVLFAPISSDLSDNIYLVQGKITDLGKDYGFTEETYKLLRNASPFYFLSSVSGAVMIHHGVKDTVVPIEFSRLLNKVLVRNKKTSLLYTYENEHHEFIKSWPLAITRTADFFNQFVKNPKQAAQGKVKK